MLRFLLAYAVDVFLGNCCSIHLSYSPTRGLILYRKFKFGANHSRPYVTRRRHLPTSTAEMPLGQIPEFIQKMVAGYFKVLF